MIQLDNAPLPLVKEQKQQHAIPSSNGWATGAAAIAEVGDASNLPKAVVVRTKFKEPLVYDAESEDWVPVKPASGTWTRVDDRHLTYLVGGPLNGKRMDLRDLGKGPIIKVHSVQTATFELYQVGNTPSEFRYHCGTEHANGVDLSVRIFE